MNIEMEGMEMNVWHKEISKDRIDDFNKKINLEAFEKHMKWGKNTYPKHQVLQTIICD